MKLCNMIYRSILFTFSLFVTTIVAQQFITLYILENIDHKPLTEMQHMALTAMGLTQNAIFYDDGASSALEQFDIYYKAAHAALGQREEDAVILAVSTLYKLGMASTVQNYLKNIEVERARYNSTSDEYRQLTQKYQYISDYAIFLDKKNAAVLASTEVQELAYQALQAMGVENYKLVTIYQHDTISCSGCWQMWINTKHRPGPWQFTVFHEAAHIALQHCKTQLLDVSITNEQIKAQEKEADLLAAKMLYELGYSNILIAVIKDLQSLCDSGYKAVNGAYHPSLEEILVYLKDFAHSKGLL